MKIRTDFVTNSSSASIIMELKFVTQEGIIEEEFAVNPEGAITDDGIMYGDDISLDLNAVKDTISEMLCANKDIEGLLEMLCESAVVTELEYNEDTDDDEEEYSSVQQLFPKTTDRLKQRCKAAGVTADSIKEISVSIEKSCGDDGHVLLEYSKELMIAYISQYAEADDDQKEDAFQKLMDYMKSEPTVFWADNKCEIKGEQQVHWDEDELREAIDEHIEKNYSSVVHSVWTATWRAAQIYDVDTGSITYKNEYWIESNYYI